MAAYRIAILGADSLLGKELGEALRERRFPCLPPRLLAGPDGDASGRKLLEFAEEPAALEPFEPEALEDVDALFFAGTPEETRLGYRRLPKRRPLLVDLTAALADEPGTQLAGLEPQNSAGETDDAPELIVVAHPAAQTLAHLLDRFGAAGKIAGATVVVLEPASQRDWAGVQELEQQTLAALSVRTLPQAVYGTQVAFNLRAELGAEILLPLAYTRSLIARQAQALRATPGPAPALELLQAPLFHATVLAFHCSFTPPEPALEQVEKSVVSAWLATPADGGYPDVLSAAGSDAIQRGPLRMDPAGGVWLFAALDNLRRTAFSAVDAAAAALEQRLREPHTRRPRWQ